MSQPSDGQPAPSTSRRGAAAWLPQAGLMVLGLAAVLTWASALSLAPADGRLRATVLDVGDGDALLIQTPDGGVALVDGGPSGRALDRGLAERLPLFTHRLDLLIVACTDSESIGALPDLLDRYDVAQVVLTEAAGKTGVYRTFVEKLNAKGITPISAMNLPAFELGAGATLRVTAETPAGSVVRLAWQDFSLVMAPGTNTEIEAGLVARGQAGPATALVAARSGSEAATSLGWVQAVNPNVVLIPVAAGNAGGAPAPAVLARLAGRTVLRTDLNGHLGLSTDGRQLWVEAER